MWKALICLGLVGGTAAAKPRAGTIDGWRGPFDPADPTDPDLVERDHVALEQVHVVGQAGHLRDVVVVPCHARHPGEALGERCSDLVDIAVPTSFVGLEHSV